MKAYKLDEKVTTKTAAKPKPVNPSHDVVKEIKLKDEPKKDSKSAVKTETKAAAKPAPIRKGGGGQPPE